MQRHGRIDRDRVGCDQKEMARRLPCGSFTRRIHYMVRQPFGSSLPQTITIPVGPVSYFARPVPQHRVNTTYWTTIVNQTRRRLRYSSMVTMVVACRLSIPAQYIMLTLTRWWEGPISDSLPGHQAVSRFLGVF